MLRQDIAPVCVCVSVCLSVCLSVPVSWRPKKGETNEAMLWRIFGIFIGAGNE